MPKGIQNGIYECICHTSRQNEIRTRGRPEKCIHSTLFHFIRDQPSSSSTTTTPTIPIEVVKRGRPTLPLPSVESIRKSAHFNPNPPKLGRPLKKKKKTHPPRRHHRRHPSNSSTAARRRSDLWNERLWESSFSSSSSSSCCSSSSDDNDDDDDNNSIVILDDNEQPPPEEKEARLELEEETAAAAVEMIDLTEEDEISLESCCCSPPLTPPPPPLSPPQFPRLDSIHLHEVVSSPPLFSPFLSIPSSPSVQKLREFTQKTIEQLETEDVEWTLGGESILPLLSPDFDTIYSV